MADEEVAGTVSSAPSDLKRKLEDLEPEAPVEPVAADSNGNSDSVAAPLNGVSSGDVEAKRPRLDELPDDEEAAGNCYQEVKEDMPYMEVSEHLEVENDPESKLPEYEESQIVTIEEPAADDKHAGTTDQLLDGSPQDAPEESAQKELLEPCDELKDFPTDVPQETEVAGPQQGSEDQVISHKVEVPSNKVGVLIGKAGDTIRTLQHNSGARIQITRDADADPYSATRPVELIGSLESIKKAEKLIKDVIAEADAGGSPSLVARGFSAVPSSSGEQIQIQVPNEKVGLIIGKGGETIRNLQTRSGARIQLVPQQLTEGDQSKERTIRISGDKKQIEMAKDMIKDVMNQTVRSLTQSNQQGFRSRGPGGSQWGPRGPHPTEQPTGHEYQQRGGPYPSQHPQFHSPPYGNCPPQQTPHYLRSNLGWDQRPSPTMQGPPPHTGYDYYGGQVVHGGPAMHGHPPGPSTGHPTTQMGYNYGHLQGPDYGQPTPYSQATPLQVYGGPAQQHPYGHGSQPPVYSQGPGQSGYGPQDQYGKPPSYNMPQQGPYSQPYGQPRPATQAGDVPYQGPIPTTQSYGQTVPTQQQPYPYQSSGPMQQSYPTFGGSNDGYSHSGHAPAYPQQQGVQPVSGYPQGSGHQTAPGYTQVGSTGVTGYGQQYLPPQQGFPEQGVPASAGYGYQGASDPTYGSGPGSAAVYGAPPSTGVQPAGSTQPTSYDQSGGYSTVPVGYGKSVSPQPNYPQFDASQAYSGGGHR